MLFGGNILNYGEKCYTEGIKGDLSRDECLLEVTD